MTRQNASCNTAPQPVLSTQIGFTSQGKGWLARLADALIEWQERAHSRVLLGRFDDRMLSDIGLTRSDVDVEISKPIWRS